MSNAELIAEVRESHTMLTARSTDPTKYCGNCDQVWPCETEDFAAALEKSEAEVVRLQATIAAVQSLVAPIVADGVGKIGTHYENCYENHAGCLAVYIADVVEGGAK